jgi:hypothetical protein
MLRFRTNPFPGMNPWLEGYWGDLHTRLTTYACDFIQKRLPQDLKARVETYLAVELPDDRPDVQRHMSPDVHVVQDDGPGFPKADTATIAMTEPVRIRRILPPQTLRYVRIIDLKDDRRVVTAIEFLSPANKTSESGRNQYRQKQRELLDARVNLVEIDFLRTGSWVIAATESRAPDNCRTPYRISVVRANDSQLCEMYPTTFSSPLPTIRIPLRDTDDDIGLPLQQLIDQAYENGGYDDIDYTTAATPPLSDAAQDWAMNYLQSINSKDSE